MRYKNGILALFITLLLIEQQSVDIFDYVVYNDIRGEEYEYALEYRFAGEKSH